MKYIAVALLFFGIISCSENKNQRSQSIDSEQDTLTSQTRDTMYIKTTEAACTSLNYIGSYGKSSFYFPQLTEEEYLKNKQEDYYKPTFYSNSDSIELLLQERYPDVFKKTDGAYLFQTENGERPIEVRNNKVQEKSYSAYLFKGEFQDYVFIFQQYYEGIEYILVNVKTGMSFLLVGPPRFISESVVYGIGGYTEVDMSIIDLLNNKSAILSYENLDMLESYPITNNVYCKVRCRSDFKKIDYFGIQVNF